MCIGPMICTAITAATIITVTTVIHKITARIHNGSTTIAWGKITRATMIVIKTTLVTTTVTHRDSETIAVETKGDTNSHNLVTNRRSNVRNNHSNATNNRKMRLRSVAAVINHNRAVVPNVLGRVGEKETVARNAEAKDKVLAVRQNGAKRLAMTVEDGKDAAQPSRRLRESTKVNEEEGEE